MQLSKFQANGKWNVQITNIDGSATIVISVLSERDADRLIAQLWGCIITIGISINA